MAEIVAFLTDSTVITILIGYIAVLWFSITIWTGMDIFARTKNWFARLGALILVGFGFLFGFVLYLIIRPQTSLEELKVRELEEKILENQSKSFVCPNCLELVRDEFLFCPSCGIKIKKECPSCKRILEIVWAQCPYCGVAAGAPSLPEIKVSRELPAQTKRGLFGTLGKIFSSPKEPVEIIEVKRKRGRPRKPQPETPVVKRGRGRPRKNAEQTTSI